MFRDTRATTFSELRAERGRAHQLIERSAERSNIAEVMQERAVADDFRNSANAKSNNRFPENTMSRECSGRSFRSRMCKVPRLPPGDNLRWWRHFP